MKRTTRPGAVLLAALGLSLGVVPGLLMGNDCATRPGCPMMGNSAGMSHCQPASSFVADCCVTRNPPADNAPGVRPAIEPRAEFLATLVDAPSYGAERAVAQPSPLAAKLHTIGRHTLFQVFLS